MNADGRGYEVQRSARRAVSLRVLCVVASLLVIGSPASAADWPQFLGPMRNGVYDGEVADSFPQDGPRIEWRRKVGDGYGGPVISDGRLVLFHRVGDEDVVECINPADGRTIWKHGYATRYFDPYGKGNGPRSTPAVADGKVFTFGAQGVLQCIDMKSGKPLWSVDTVKEYGSDKGFFGRACSPLVEGELVLLNIGGVDGGAGVGAFDVNSGKLVWKATDHEAGYASPVAATIGARRYAFFFTRTGLVAVEPKSGDVLFTHRWRSAQQASVNAAAPLIVGDTVLLTSSYDTGATALAVSGKSFETLWSADTLAAQYVTPVHKDGFIYGFDGRHDFNETKLACIELKTGKSRWSQDMPGGPVVLADDKLIILTEDGGLILAKASPRGYERLAEAKPLRASVRACPALVDGFLYARDDGQLICIDLRKAR